MHLARLFTAHRWLLTFAFVLWTHCILGRPFAEPQSLARSLRIAAQSFTVVAKPASDLQPFFNEQVDRNENEQCIDSSSASALLNWVGGDVATSLKISNNTYLWLFGDTLIGCYNSSNGIRHVTKLPRNSVGVVAVETAAGKRSWPTVKGTVEYHWREDATFPKHGGFFTPQNTSRWLWVIQGLPVLTHDLVLFADEVSASRGGGPLEFVTHGTVAIRVRGGQSLDPSLWHSKEVISLSTIPQTNSSFSLTTATATLTLTSGDFVYLFGNVQFSKGAVVARIHSQDLLAFRWERLQFFTDSQQWQSTSQASRWVVPFLRPLFAPAPGTSVIWSPYLSAWLALKLSFASSQLEMQWATDLTDAWSQPVQVYDIPKPWSSPPIFSYAPKFHPEFGNANVSEFVISFMSDGDFAIIQDHPQIYVPQLIRVKLARSFDSSL